MDRSLKRALALMIALLLAMPTFAFAEAPVEVTDVLIGAEEAWQAPDEGIEPPTEEMGEILLGELPPEDGMEAAEAPFRQAAAIDGVTITVSAGAGVFPADATLRAGRVDDEAAALAVEAAFGRLSVYTHRLYRVEVVDGTGSAFSPENGSVRMQGLDLPAGTRVAAVDDDVRELSATQDPDEDAIGFDLTGAAVYDLFTIEETEGLEVETVEQPAEQIVEEPVESVAAAEEVPEGGAVAVQTVSVVFDATPGTALVTVRPAEGGRASPPRRTAPSCWSPAITPTAPGRRAMPLWRVCPSP